MTALNDELARRAVELLSDGQWRDLEAVMAELAVVVPPGRALRQNEQERRKNHKNQRGDGPKQRYKPRPTDYLIASGRRSIVREFLHNPRVFELDRAGVAGARAGVGPNAGRKIRMIAEPRALRAEALRQSLDRAQLRAEHLQAALESQHQRVAKLRKYLVEIGHEEAANRLAPDGEE